MLAPDVVCGLHWLLQGEHDGVVSDGDSRARRRRGLQGEERLLALQLMPEGRHHLAWAGSAQPQRSSLLALP